MSCAEWVSVIDAIGKWVLAVGALAAIFFWRHDE